MKKNSSENIKVLIKELMDTFDKLSKNLEKMSKLNKQELVELNGLAKDLSGIEKVLNKGKLI